MAGLNHKFCVAPMMDWTDRHCRVLHRLLTRHAVLYTEMLTAAAVLHGDRVRLLAFSPEEHPVALQLGGAEPRALAEAASIGEAAGYDEINLNVGCPSDRVQSGRFGACLMAEPGIVAESVAAMRACVALPVTVKCRIGIDDQDPEDVLPGFAALMERAGAQALIVHARKAWLKGLSPKKNRDVPPLDYDLVYRLKQAMPRFTIVLNGGIVTLDEAERHLSFVDGVMMGRAAYQSAALLAGVDRRFFGAAESADLLDVAGRYAAYAGRQRRLGVPMATLARPLIGLMQSRPGARAFRRVLTEEARRPEAGPEVIAKALAEVGGAAPARVGVLA
jgi:tRNA-dihydrouridine synthase A